MAPRYPTRRPVIRQRQARSPPQPPGLQQCVRQQRQRARLSTGVSDGNLHQGRFHRQPSARRRSGDDSPQVAVVHRADQHLPAPQRRHKRGVRRTPAVEIGPHPEHHPRARLLRPREERGDEPGPLLFVPAEGEHLLELVDHEQIDRVRFEDREVSSQLVGRPFTRCHEHRPAVPARWKARGGRGRERGQQARPQQGGLACTGRREQGEKARRTQRFAQLLHQLFTAEEPLGVTRLERCEAEIRCAPAVTSTPADGLISRASRCQRASHATRSPPHAST